MNIGFFKYLKDNGARGLVVGGWVRDRILGISSQDVDIEVFGMTEDQLEQALRSYFLRNVDVVGKSFGVFKIDNFDFSLPRRERKVGEGYRGFTVEVDPDMSIKDASLRRDFTFNAIYFDPLTMEYVDPHGGMEDLKNKTLRHTSPAFAEDPLRVMRGFQFCSRFGLQAPAETLDLCRKLQPEFKTISKERILGEFKKWARGKHPQLGLEFLMDSGWFHQFEPFQHYTNPDEFYDMANRCQYFVDNVQEVNPYKRFIVMMSILLAATPMNEVYSFLDKGLKCDKDSRKHISEILRNKDFLAGDITPKTTRCLIYKRNKFGTLPMLFLFLESMDKSMSDELALMKNLCDKEIESNPSMKCWVRGRDLMDIGYKQDKDIGIELRRLRNLQIEHGYNRTELLGQIK